MRRAVVVIFQVLAVIAAFLVLVILWARGSVADRQLECERAFEKWVVEPGEKPRILNQDWCIDHLSDQFLDPQGG